MLHNIALDRKQPDFDEGIEEGESCAMPTTNVPEPSSQQESRTRRLGFEKRKRIAANVFARRAVNS